MRIAAATGVFSLLMASLLQAGSPRIRLPLAGAAATLPAPQENPQRSAAGPPRARTRAADGAEGDSVPLDLAFVLAGECSDEQLLAIARQPSDSGRRRSLFALAQLLRDPNVPVTTWRNAARLATHLPDPSLAEPLLARLELSFGELDRELVTALKGAIEATRRRWIELEVERVATGSAEAALTSLDHSESGLRRAAATRLVELLKRSEAVRDDIRDRLRETARSQFAEIEPDGTVEFGLLAELLAAIDPERDLAIELSGLFSRTLDGARRAALLPALRSFPLERGGAEVAEALTATLREWVARPVASADAPFVEALLDALRPLADERRFDVLESATHVDQPEGVRVRAIAAATEAGRRATTAEGLSRVVERLAALLVDDHAASTRFAAVLGLGQLQEVLAARRESGGESGTDAVSLARIFQAARDALRTTGDDRTLAETCIRTICRAPDRAADAAAVLAEALLRGVAEAGVREALLGGLKELGHRDGLPAILAQLPRGGPGSEADAVGKAAYGAWLAVLRSAEAAGDSLDVEIAAVDSSLALGEPEWAVAFAARLLERLDHYDEAEPQHRIRLAYGVSIAAQRHVASYRRAYEECEWVALQSPAGSDRGQLARQLLLELGEQIGPELAGDAVLYGGELLRELVDSTERGALCLRVARQLFAAGEWNGAYDWLDREHDEAGADLEVVLLKARAAARREDPAAMRDALRLHELLLGRGGAGGGRLPADSPLRVGCALALAGLLHDAGRTDDARALLAVLPEVAELPAELQAERRRIAEKLDTDRGP